MALTNGGFEDGDFTGWTIWSGSPTVQSAIKKSGTYAAKIEVAGEGDEDFFYQNVGDVNAVTINYYLPTCEGDCQLRLMLTDGTNVLSEDISTTNVGFEAFAFDDLSTLTDKGSEGVTIQIAGNSYNAGEDLTAYIDDISIEEAVSKAWIGKSDILLEKAWIGKSDILLIKGWTGKYAIQMAKSVIGKYQVSPPLLHWKDLWKVKFKNGDVEVTIGDIITGATSGATARVYNVVLASGSWSAGTAAGYLYFETTTGQFSSTERLLMNVIDISGPISATSTLSGTLTMVV